MLWRNLFKNGIYIQEFFGIGILAYDRSLNFASYIQSPYDCGYEELINAPKHWCQAEVRFNIRPHLRLSLLLHIPLIYPSSYQLHLSTTSLIQESSTVYNLYQDWKHSISRSTLYQESTVRSTASSSRYSQEDAHSTLSIPRMTIFWKEEEESSQYYLFTIIYKDLFWNLRSYLVVEEHYVSITYLITCLPGLSLP